MKKKEVTLPTILGLLVAVVGLVSGLWLLGGRLRQSAEADTEEAPNEIRVVNTIDSSFTVIWLTQKSVAGFIQYGEASARPDLVVSDERDQQKGAIGSYFTHYVTVRGLKPATKYSFRIGSGKRVYDEEGGPYEVTTAGPAGATPAADVAYGQVVTENAEPAEGALVYLTMGGMEPQAALVKASGSWVIPLSTARSADLSGFVAYDKSTAEIEIVVQGGTLGMSEVKATTQNDSPVPDITLGKSYDLRGAGQSAEEGGSPSSKFSADSLGPATEVIGDDLIILTPKFGEKVNSPRPQIIGEAPPGTEVTIEIKSDPVTGKVVAGSDGKFSFSVPADLAPGEHGLTITAVIDGVVKKVTRSFTVYAAGESAVPAFSATPSATLVPSKTPTPTMKPSPTVRPTATPTPTPGGSGGAATSPTPTPTTKPTATPSPTRVPTPVPVVASPSGIPTVGNEGPTMVILVVALAFILSGGWWYRQAQ